MKFFRKAKDGGPESNVTGYWLVEIKWLFSIALLRFSHGTRDVFHSHAFHAISWLLRGRLVEQFAPVTSGGLMFCSRDEHGPSLRPIVTLRSTFHRVRSIGTTWVITFRGPWSKTWRERDPKTGINTVLTYGRKIVDVSR